MQMNEPYYKTQVAQLTCTIGYWC